MPYWWPQRVWGHVCSVAGLWWLVCQLSPFRFQCDFSPTLCCVWLFQLTYDYKFDFEDDQHKIPCLCGAAYCRKWMNWPCDLSTGLADVLPELTFGPPRNPPQVAASAELEATGVNTERKDSTTWVVGFQKVANCAPLKKNYDSNGNHDYDNSNDDERPDMNSAVDRALKSQFSMTPRAPPPHRQRRSLL